jgi:aconitate hydratase
MPSDSRLLPYRSNIPHLSNFCFEKIDPDFAGRAKAAGEGVIIGGDNYGQGSSREHAALVPLYLGIRFVIAKSFARIHRSNLINSGIIPLTFENLGDYDALALGQRLVIKDVLAQIDKEIIEVTNADTGATFKTINALSDLEKQMVRAGGKINMLRAEAQ